MKTSAYIILIAFVATFVLAPPASGAGVVTVDKGRKDRPKDPPDPPPDNNKRPDRPKPPPDDGGGTRPPREKPDEPRPPADNGNNDDDGYQPPYQPPWEPPPHHPCPDCGQYGCWLDHDMRYYRPYTSYSSERPVSPIAGMYLLGSASMIFVNLMYAADGSSRGTGAGIAGMVLGVIGFISAGVAEDPEAKTNLFYTGLVSIAMAAVNLANEPAVDDPVYDAGQTVKSRGVSFTLSF